MNLQVKATGHIFFQSNPIMQSDKRTKQQHWVPPPGWLSYICISPKCRIYFKFATLSDGVLCTIEMYSYSCTANLSQKQWWVQPKPKLKLR